MRQTLEMKLQAVVDAVAPGIDCCCGTGTPITAWCDRCRAAAHLLTEIHEYRDAIKKADHQSRKAA